MIKTKYILNWVAEDYNNPKLLVLRDLSIYPENPDKPIWQIKLPDFDRVIELSANAGKSIYLDSNLLGFSKNAEPCDLLDLPDGIWTITYRVCPYDELYHSAYFYKTSLLQKKFDLVLADNSTVENELLTNVSNAEIMNIFILIESSKACARLGEHSKAITRYKAALNLVTKLTKRIYG